MRKTKIFLSLLLVTALVFAFGAHSALADDASLAAMATKLEAAGLKAYEADADSAAAAKTKAEALVAELLTGSGISATVNSTAFTAATTVDSTVQPNVDGKYTFTVTLSDGVGTPLTTKELTMIIIPEIEECLLQEIIYHLVDVIGPRLSGTISEYRACEYMREQFEKVDGGENIYNIVVEDYMYDWVPAKGVQMNPANRTQYGYLFANDHTQYGVIEADVPSGAAAIGNPYPNSASFRDFEGGLFHDFGIFNASTNRVSSTPAESAVLAAGGKVYGTLRFDRAVTGTMLNAAIANIKAAYTSNVDVAGLFVARYDSTRNTSNPVSYTYNDIPLSVSSYTTATTAVVGLTLVDLEKAKVAGEAGLITNTYRIDPEIGWLTYATKPAADPDNPDLVIVYESHIDTVKGAPGATDTATGVAALAEMMRRFKYVDTGNIEIIFAAVGAEEYNDFSASLYLIEKLRAEGKDAVTVTMMFDTPAMGENAVNVLNDPIDTWAIGTLQYQERYQYPNYRNATYGDNMGTATSAFNLASYLVCNFAGEIDWPVGIKNVRINNWGASDHAMWSYFGIDACRPSSVARSGNFSISSANAQVYRYQYHSALDNMDEYNYDSHLKTTNLLAQGIQKAVDLQVSKRAKFAIHARENTVTLSNAAQLFRTYEVISGTFVGPGGNIPFTFTPDKTVIKLANAKDYTVTNLVATGMGIGNHNDVRLNGLYKELVTKLAASVEIVYDFNLYLDAASTEVAAADTLYVDVMLKGGINYTQVNTAINFDAGLLQFAGYENLSGLAAEVKMDGVDKIALRSVPSINMLQGAPCVNPVRLVTLKFTATENLEAKTVDTAVTIAAAAVTPTASIKIAELAPLKPLPITLKWPAGAFPVKVSYEGRWQDGLDEVTVETGGRLALRAVYFTGDANSPTGRISTDTAAIQTGKAIAFQWYQSSTPTHKGAPIPHAMGNDYMPNTGLTGPQVVYYYAELTYTPNTAAPAVTEKYYSDIVKVTVTPNSFPASLLTTSEASGWISTTTSAEVYEYCKNVAAISDGRIKMVDIGYTAGRSTPQNPSSPQPVPMLIIGKPAPASPAEVPADKTVALVECNIHSGEVEGKEAMLIFAREVILGLHDDLLEDLVILLVPNQNADGNDYLYKQRINSQYTPKMVGARFTGKDVNPYISAGSYSATSESHNWYNGNRDMTKLDTPECTAVVKVMNEWDPVIFVDCHATNGSLMRHAVTFNWGLHPNTDAAIMDYNMGEFAVKSVGTDSYLYNVQGKTTQPYGNFSGGALAAGTTRWNSFEDYPRYTTNYAGLRNRLAMILEVYSHDPYTVRVDTQYACVYGILKAVADDKDNIKTMIAAADKHAVERSVKGFDPAVDFVALNSRMDYLYDIKVETYLAAPTGSSPLSYALRDDENDRCGTVYAGEAEYTIGYYGNWTPTERMPMGAYYLLDADCAEAVALLQKHGIKVDRLEEPLSIAAGDFQWFKATRRAQSATGSVYEGHLRNNFVGAWQTTEAAQIFPAGTYVVTTSQTLGALAALLLEPAAVDGAITWNFFDNQLNAATGMVRANYPSVTTDTGSPTYYLPVFKVTDFDVL